MQRFRGMFQQAEPKNISSELDARRWMKLHTVSKAFVYDDGTAAGPKASCGALFWISRAIWNIVLNVAEYLFWPKDTEWKESALLHRSMEISELKEGTEQPQTRGGLQRGTNLEPLGSR